MARAIFGTPPALPTDGAGGRPLPLVISTGDAEENRKLVAEHDAEEGSMVEFLMEELYPFVAEGWEQEDDITLLTLRRSPSLS